MAFPWHPSRRSTSAARPSTGSEPLYRRGIAPPLPRPSHSPKRAWCAAVCASSTRLSEAVFPAGSWPRSKGAPGSGRSAVAARLLATATANGGLGALVEFANGPDGAFYPPALAAAGVDLERLIVVTATDAAGVARAADILLRAAAFGVVVIPAVSLRAQAWTRLASLTHRANALLVALGSEASDELRYFASLRIRLQASHVRWSGGDGLFCTLAGIGVDASVLKHKRAAPGKRAHFGCTTFEREGAPLGTLRERTLADVSAPAARERRIAL